MNLQGAHAAAASLSLSVSIQGLGPRFRLLISLVNEGTELATDLQVGGHDIQPGWVDRIGGGAGLVVVVRGGWLVGMA